MNAVNEIMEMSMTIDKRRKAEGMDKRKKAIKEEGEEDAAPEGPDTPERAQMWLDKISTKAARIANKNDIIALYDTLVRELIDTGRFQTPALNAALKNTWDLM